MLVFVHIDWPAAARSHGRSRERSLARILRRVVWGGVAWLGGRTLRWARTRFRAPRASFPLIAGYVLAGLFVLRGFGDAADATRLQCIVVPSSAASTPGRETMTRLRSQRNSGIANQVPPRLSVPPPRGPAPPLPRAWAALLVNQRILATPPAPDAAPLATRGSRVPQGLDCPNLPLSTDSADGNGADALTGRVHSFPACATFCTRCS